MINIVIVDDSNFMRNMLRSLLTNEGYNVVGEGQDGDEAIELYKRLKPDIITLDITMPYKDGLQAGKEILEYDKNAKVIMCSAMGQRLMVLEALKYGVRDFIVKPFHRERVLEAINNAMK